MLTAVPWLTPGQQLVLVLKSVKIVISLEVRGSQEC